MKKIEWPDYWQRRCVKAENMLTAISAHLGDEHEVSKKITEYFRQIAAGDKANYADPFAASLHPSTKEKS